MEFTEEQYQRIAPRLPVQRGNVKIPNRRMLNAILYITENGCKWRSLPSHFRKWNTIYCRMSRWAKTSVLDKVFEKLQAQTVVPPEKLTMDSPSIKVHPDGTGALKKTARNPLGNLAEAGIPKFTCWLQASAKQ